MACQLARDRPIKDAVGLHLDKQESAGNRGGQHPGTLSGEVRQPRPLFCVSGERI